jgi:predicted ATPase
VPISDEMRRLQTQWGTRSNWPKQLEWIQVDGLRGWTGQTLSLDFPIMAIIGENGAGKSTLLQCAMSVYSTGDKAKERYASDHFLDTPWEHIEGATISYSIREGDRVTSESIRRPTTRWRGNQHRPSRHVEWFDLSRVQPISARAGYSRITSPGNTETEFIEFAAPKLARLGRIMSRPYTLAKMALTKNDGRRSIPVLKQEGAEYSGFHQGAGETTVAELLQADIPEYSLVLIDEIESSLHPRAQRRLMRELATICRDNKLQIILTTHSPYILEELPPEARAYIMQTPPHGERSIVYGVSPDFAMSRMDDVHHPECDVYVEDEAAAAMLTEIVTATDADVLSRCAVWPYGAASVGKSLGQMIVNNRFPRPTVVFLDGDTGGAPGCLLLPGEDAPERVIFRDLQALDSPWGDIDKRISRPYAAVADACSRAMQLSNHHEWVESAATQLRIPGSMILWHAMCSEWARLALDPAVAAEITEAIRDKLDGISPGASTPIPVVASEPVATQTEEPAATTPAPASTSEPAQPQTLFDSVAQG